MRRLSEGSLRANGTVVTPRVVAVLLVILRNATSDSAYGGCRPATCPAASLPPRLSPPPTLVALVCAAANRRRSLRHAPAWAHTAAEAHACASVRGERRDAASDAKLHVVTARERERARAGIPVELAACFHQPACTQQSRRSGKHYRLNGGAQARHGNGGLANSTNGAIGRLDDGARRAHPAGSSVRGANVAACPSVDDPKLCCLGPTAHRQLPCP